MSAHVDAAVAAATEADAVAMVYELPGLGGRAMTPIVMLAIGKGIGIWQRAWRLSGVERPIDLGIPAARWRATEIGGPIRPTEEWKAAAWETAARRWPALELPDRANELPDALLLGAHALRSLDLADALGTRFLRTLGWSEPRGAWVDGVFVPAEPAEG